MEDWTAELWIGTANTNPLTEPIHNWYERCGCQPSDPDEQDNQSLVANGQACRDYVLGADLVEKLKKRKATTDGDETLYKSIKGVGRSDGVIYKALGKVKMGGIRLLTKERGPGGQKNVIFGLVPRVYPMFDRAGAMASASSSGAGPSD